MWVNYLLILYYWQKAPVCNSINLLYHFTFFPNQLINLTVYILNVSLFQHEDIRKKGAELEKLAKLKKYLPYKHKVTG